MKMIPLMLFGLLMSQALASETVLKKIVMDSDRTVDCSSEEAICKELLTDDMTPQQKVMTIWRFVVMRNMHKEHVYQTERGNCAELLSVGSYGLCGYWSGASTSLLAAAGLKAARVGCKGHWITAVEYWGGWHTFDFDMWTVYGKESGEVIKVHELAKNIVSGGYNMRETPCHKSYPWYIGRDTIKTCSGCLSKLSLKGPTKARTHPRWRGGMDLRPGQRIIWHYEGDPELGNATLTHIGRKKGSLLPYIEGTKSAFNTQDPHTSRKKEKWTWGWRRGGIKANSVCWNGVNGNGRVIFDLLRDGGKYALQMAEQVKNLEVKDGTLCLVEASQPGSLVLDFASAYPYADGFIEKPLPEKGVVIALEYDKGKKRDVYNAKHKSLPDDGKRLRLFNHIRCKAKFKIHLSLEPGTAPLKNFKAVGVFHHSFTALPSLLKGKNEISLRSDNPAAMADRPVVLTYIYDQMNDAREIKRHDLPLIFTKDKMTNKVDAGDKHHPLMRSISMEMAAAPLDSYKKKEGPMQGNMDWGGYAWNWAYPTVNFWNDFERGDRQGFWGGKLTTEKTYGGSDFALTDYLAGKGTRECKIIRLGARLNRNTKFRCEVYVENVKAMRFYTQDTADKKHYAYTQEDFPNGKWTTFLVDFKKCVYKANDKVIPMPQNIFCYNTYIKAVPRDGVDLKDVVFIIDNVIDYDGELKFDPFKDPEADKKAIVDNPVWKYRPKGE